MDEKINILLFGVLAEKFNTNSLKFDKVNDTDTLITLLKNEYSFLNEINFSIAVNKKIIHENTYLKNNDDIALMPPFSGG